MPGEREYTTPIIYIKWEALHLKSGHGNRDLDTHPARAMSLMWIGGISRRVMDPAGF
jgi:hypothetical protein